MTSTGVNGDRSSKPTAPVDPNLVNPDEVRAQAVRDFLGDIGVGTQLGAYTIVGIAPILVMWFGFDWQSKAAVVVVMVFFPVLVNTVAGLAGDFFGDAELDELVKGGVGRGFGVGAASAVTVFVRNGGNGQTATDEAAGVGAMALAEALELRVRAGARPPADMLTMSERVATASVA